MGGRRASIVSAAPALAATLSTRRLYEANRDLAELGHALRCLKYFESSTGEDYLAGQRFGRTRPRAERTAVCIQRFEHPAPARNSLGELVNRALQPDTHAIA